jgi:hypothetical protein
MDYILPAWAVLLAPSSGHLRLGQIVTPTEKSLPGELPLDDLSGIIPTVPVASLILGYHVHWL